MFRLGSSQRGSINLPAYCHRLKSRPYSPPKMRAINRTFWISVALLLPANQRKLRMPTIERTLTRSLSSSKLPLEHNWYHARQRAARGEDPRDLMLDVLTNLRNTSVRVDGHRWARVDLTSARAHYPGIHPLIFSGLLSALRAEGVYRMGLVELHADIS